MSESNSGPDFLRQRYPGLANSPEVTQAAKRTAPRTHTDVSRDPEERIQNYLDRFKEIVDNKEPQKRSGGIAALKKVLTDRYVVRVEDIPDSYWEM